MDQDRANRAGILAMLGAQALFVVNDTLVKLVAVSLPPSQIMVVRGIMASLLAIGLVAMMGGLAQFRFALRRIVMVRALLEAIVAFTFITALARLSIATATTLILATPLIMTALSVVMLGERVGWRRWTATALGFVGVVIVMRPSPAGIDAGMLVGLACAVFIALRDIITRRIGEEVPSVVITFTTTAMVVVAGLATGLLENASGAAWPVPDLPTLVSLALAALTLVAGNYLIVLAFRTVEVSVVSPFRYGVVLFAIASGVLVWDDWPDAVAFLGTALIVGCGLYTLRREARVGVARSTGAAP